MGVLACGYGLPSVVINGVQVLYINYHNLKPNFAPYKNHPGEKYFTQPEVLDRVPEIFLGIGGSFLAIQLICCIFLVNPSQNDSDANEVEEEEMKSMTSESLKEEEEERESEGDKSHDNDQLLSTKDALKKLLQDRNFYLLWLMFFAAGIVAAFIIELYKAFGFEIVTDDDYFLTIVGSVSALLNSLGRVPWGLLIDFTGYKFAFIFHGSFTAMFLSTLYTASAVGGEVFYFIWVCVIFCGVGAYFAFFPTAVANSFGVHHYSMNYGIITTALGIGGVAGAIVPKFAVRAIGWFGIILLITCIQVAELIMALFLRSSD